MCINPQSSLNSFIFSICCSGFLFFRNKPFDIGNAAFIISFTTIQLLEYFIWKSIDSNNLEDNSYYTRLVPIVLFAQPLIQTYFSYTYTKSYNLLIFIYIFMGILLYTIYTINNFNYKSVKGPNKHLIWYKIDKISNEKSIVIQRYFFGYIYLIGMGIGLYYTGNYSLLSYGIGSFLFILNNYSEDEFSSMWCFVAIGYSLLCIFM